MQHPLTPRFTATPHGITIDGMPLNKSTYEIPAETMCYVKRAEALLATVKKEDWDDRTPHALHDVPTLAKVQMLLALASPQSLAKGFNPNEPRDHHGKWTSTDGVTAADLKNPRFKGIDRIQIKKQKFIDANLAAAEKGAKQLNVPIENILGLSGVESGWGRDKFPMMGNNYFGQHSHAPMEIGSFPVDKDPTVRGAKFDSYSDSLQSFIETRGDIIQGVSDPTQFTQALQDSGAYGIIKGGTPKHPIYYPDPTYVPKIVETIQNLSAYILRARQQ